MFVTAQGVDWEALLAKRVKPPFLPSIKAPADVSNFDEEFTRLKPLLTPPHTPFFLTAEQQEIFADFDFSSLHWVPETDGQTRHDTSRLCPNPALVLSFFFLYLYLCSWTEWSWFTVTRLCVFLLLAALCVLELHLMKESSSCRVAVTRCCSAS